MKKLTRHRQLVLPTSYRRAVPPKMRRNFRNRKIASVPVKGPAFSDPKGASRPSAEEKVSGEGKAEQPRGRGAKAPARLWFLSPRRERNRTAACGRGKVETRCKENKCITEKAEHLRVKK